MHWSTKTGNGSLYSTVDDLYRFDRALNGESVLKAASRQKYFVEGEGNRYGWYIGQRLGHRIMSAKGRGTRPLPRRRCDYSPLEQQL